MLASKHPGLEIKILCMCIKSLQSFLTLCNPMDCGPPGSSVCGILQARILEWVAISSSRGSSQLGDQTCIPYVSCIGRRVIYHSLHLGSPEDTALLYYCTLCNTAWQSTQEHTTCRGCPHVTMTM